MEANIVNDDILERYQDSDDTLTESDSSDYDYPDVGIPRNPQWVFEDRDRITNYVKSNETMLEMLIDKGFIPLKIKCTFPGCTGYATIRKTGKNWLDSVNLNGYNYRCKNHMYSAIGNLFFYDTCRHTIRVFIMIVFDWYLKGKNCTQCYDHFIQIEYKIDYKSIRAIYTQARKACAY